MEKYKSLELSIYEPLFEADKMGRKFFTVKPTGKDAVGWKFAPGKGPDPESPNPKMPRLIKGFWGVRVRKATGEKRKTASERRAIGRAIKKAAKRRTASQKKKIAKKALRTRMANK